MKTINIRPLNEDLADKAINELHENPNTIYDELEKFREWISKQIYIKARTDDQFLIAFLRGCKYDHERAYNKIDTYYKIRTTAAEHFASRDLTERKLQEAMSLGISLPLPTVHDTTGARILLVRQAAYDPYIFQIDDILKVGYMISDICLWEDDNYIICGGILLADLKGFSFSHIAQFSPSLIKKIVRSIQDAYPTRVKGIHFINVPTGFYSLYRIFYNFMTQKLKQRIFVHDNLDTLHQHLPKYLLPLEYGGDGGTIQSITDLWTDRLLNRSDWFLEDDAFKTDETIRPAKTCSSYRVIGYISSFFNRPIKKDH